MNIQGKEQLLSAVDISASMLQHLKSEFVKKQGDNIGNVVISVPARFNEIQRSDTHIAAIKAGFQNVELINEPTAAAMAFGLISSKALSSHVVAKQAESDTPLCLWSGTTTPINVTKRRILVFDLGGGTFDVTVLEIRAEDGVKLLVKASEGDLKLGEKDFDRWLMSKTVLEIDRPPDSSLLLEFERAKIALGEKKDSVTLQAGDNITVTQKDLVEMVRHFWPKIEKVIRAALKTSAMQKHDIDEVIMVGGSSKLLPLKEMVDKFFHYGKRDFTWNILSLRPVEAFRKIFRKVLNDNAEIDKDEAVSIGAAIRAYESFNPLMDIGVGLVDVSNYSIGIDCAGSLEVIIPRCTPVPCSESKLFQTSEDNQAGMTIGIYEGDVLDQIAKNVKLGELTMAEIQLKPAGQVTFHITFELGRDGCLDVSVQEPVTKKMVRQNIRAGLVP